MAWIFSLSAECGTDKQKAESVAKHFDGFVAILDDDLKYFCNSGVSFIDGAWWAICCPDGVSRTGVSSKEDERILTAVGMKLYERLRSSPSFRYALVGVEVDGFREYSEIDDDVIELDFSGLVISDAIWNRLGSPEIFEPFEIGYHWWPFVRAR